MLIDIHAHFYTELSNRTDWRILNQARLDAGRTIGVTAHVASILGTWGARSPTYLPSPDDVVHANDRMVEVANEYDEVFGYCLVNPNYTARKYSHTCSHGLVWPIWCTLDNGIQLFISLQHRTKRQ